MFKKATLWRGLTAVFLVLAMLGVAMTDLAVANEGSVNTFLKVNSGTVTVTADAAYRSDYGELSEESLALLLQAEDDFNARTMQEGAVLLKNDGALPLTSEERHVTLFGRASADPIYRSTSAGPELYAPRLVNFKSAFLSAGFTINESLYHAYETSTTSRKKGTGDVENIGEESISFYTDELRASFPQFSDAAIVVLSRDGGEGNDLSLNDVDGLPQLALHDQEKDLLRMIQSAGCFGKTIVLINSGYPMELGWLEEEAYGVNACLWIGNPGLTALSAVPGLLTGEVSPSGRLTDTYAASSLSAPAMRNFGDYTYQDARNDRAFAHYLIEAEGIYVGYKYYETRYQDEVLGLHHADSAAGVFAGNGGWHYADEMTFPFGFGLSYTRFIQRLERLEWNRETATVTAEVKVTNTGSVAGKEVVQLYAQTPYTSYDEANRVEKSAIQLLAFAKTETLQPGESTVITLTADEYLLASYDAYGAKGYILDEGDYVFAIGDHVHDALNHMLAAQGMTGLFDENDNAVEGEPDRARIVRLEAFDAETYRNSRITGQQVINRFEDADYNYYIEDTVSYLTRADWNTYPISYENLPYTQAMYDAMNDDAYTWESGEKTWNDYSLGVDKGIKLTDMRGVALDDPKWEEFLDQLSIKDLTSITSDNMGSAAVRSVSKPAVFGNDGPDGYKGNYQFGEKMDCTVYMSQIGLASTWNIDLVKEKGSFLAEDALYAGGSIIYAPGVNIHRTPYSGRNFEYYSEDAIFSYLCAAAQVAALQAKGTLAGPKHFAANDQETNRNGVCTFLTEQALREGPMKAFEGGFTQGGSLSTMTSYNRIGCVNDCSSWALLTAVLRGEWGFTGFTITDAQSPTSTKMAVRALEAGSDVWCLSPTAQNFYKEALNAKDAYVLGLLRETNKRYYYALLRSNVVNGLETDAPVTDFVPWWRTTLYVLDGVLAALAILSLAGYGISLRTARRKEEKRHAESV